MKRERYDGEKARQGRMGWQVLYVLAIGLLLAFIAWALADLVTPTGGTTGMTPASWPQGPVRVI